MHGLRHARKNIDTMSPAELLNYAAGRRKAAETATEPGRKLGFIDAAKRAERKARAVRQDATR